MQDGKAEVLDLKLEGVCLRVTLAGREDCAVWIALMRALTAPGTTFELVGDNAVLCKPPGVR